MVVLTNHMLTGVCLCVIPVLERHSCLGLIILACVLQQLCTTSQERERERERESDLEDLLSLSRRDEISQRTQSCLP